MKADGSKWMLMMVWDSPPVDGTDINDDATDQDSSSLDSHPWEQKTQDHQCDDDSLTQRKLQQVHDSLLHFATSPFCIRNFWLSKEGKLHAYSQLLQGGTTATSRLLENIKTDSLCPEVDSSKGSLLVWFGSAWLTKHSQKGMNKVAPLPVLGQEWCGHKVRLEKSNETSIYDIYSSTG